MEDLDRQDKENNTMRKGWVMQNHLIERKFSHRALNL